MTDFKASTAVDPLNYDFKPYCDAKGTVPEPTDDQVAKFYADQARNLQEALPPEKLEGVDLQDPVEVSNLLVDLDESDYSALYEWAVGLYSAVCSNKPSHEEIEALPHRLRRAWYGMVQEWLRPESSRTATDD